MTVYLVFRSSTRMIAYFKDKERWSIHNGKHVCTLLFHGDTYAVSPGDVKYWQSDVEKYLKHHAYTSELGIDWWYKPVAVRHNGITRGMIFELDHWLYKKIVNMLH